MSTASLAASDQGAAVRIDRLFLGLALAATAILVALVLLDHQPASAALILGGFGLGSRIPQGRVQLHRVVAAFPHARRSRRASRRADRDRDLRARGRAGGGAAARNTAAPSRRSGRRWSSARSFSASACSSPMAAAPARSTRSAAARGACWSRSLFFVIGSVFGSLSLPAFLALGGIDPVLASDYLGAWGGLAATLVSIAIAAALIIAVARRRGANFMPSRNYIIGGIAIGLLCVAVFFAGGHPWSVTFGYTVWGAKAATRSASTFRTRHSGNGRDPSMRLPNPYCPTPRA